MEGRVLKIKTREDSKINKRPIRNQNFNSSQILLSENMVKILGCYTNFKSKLDNSKAHSTILPVAFGFLKMRCKGKRVTTVI
jgi:hypothetical protein